MGTFSIANNPIDGDVYIQKLSTYVRRNEEALANGLLCFSKSRNTVGKVKPLRLKFTIHHLYFITERIESSLLGVEVGPLNVKLDTPNHEPTFISFMANNARSMKHVDSDTKSITSMNSVKSIVSNASAYWRLSLHFSKDPNVIVRDLRYLYSSFTKIPCLILTRKSNLSSINMYEEYPCDTSVPMKMFKNLQVLELVGYEPNEIFGWHVLSDQLRILIVRDSKLSNLADCLFNLVVADEVGRMSFSGQKQPRKSSDHSNSHTHSQSILEHPHLILEYPPLPSSGTQSKQPDHSHPYTHMPLNYQSHQPQVNNPFARNTRRKRASTLPGKTPILPEIDAVDPLGSNSSNANTPFTHPSNEDCQTLGEEKWALLKQLLVSETSISFIPSYVFKPLCNIVKLNLSHNLLSEIPPGLEQLQNVKYLNFSDNYIESLVNLPLSLKHLSVLNLSNNKLACLDGLDNLFRVDKLDLRNNQIDSMGALKPLLVHFKKESSSLSGVYLSSNKLPKAYRSELFNLFNGIKLKNNIKIDESRPGYFEGALLLDNEAAAKLAQKYFAKPALDGDDETQDAVAPTVGGAAKALAKETYLTSPNTVIPKPIPNTLPLTTVSSSSSPPIGTSPNYSTHNAAQTLAKSLAALSTADTKQQSVKLDVPRDMLHTYVLSRPQADLHSPHHVIDSPTSLGDELRPCGFSSPATSTAARVSVCSYEKSESESVLTLKGPININQLELQQQQSTNTAPSVMTPLQVTARMST